MLVFLRRLVKGFNARYLGLAFLVPVFETFRRIAFSLPLQAADLSWGGGSCIAACAVGAALSCLILLLVALEGRCLSLRMKGFMGLIGTIVFGCMLALALFSASDALRAVASVTMFFIVGIYLVILLCGWVRAYAAKGCNATTLVYIALPLCLGSLFKGWFVTGPSPLAQGAVILVCLATSSFLLLGFREDGGALRGDGISSAQGIVPRERFRVWVDAGLDDRRLGRVVRSALNVAAIGFCLCFFAWGVMAVPPSVYVSDQSSWVTSVGACVALVVMVVFVYTLGDEVTFEGVREKIFFFMPVFAIFLAYFSFVRMLDANGALKHVLSIGWNTGTFGFAALAIFVASMRSREKGIDIEFLVLPVILLATTLYVAGIVSYRLLANNAMYLQIVLTTLYILGLSLVSTRKASLNEGARVEKRCRLLAGTRGLSARETEILLLLAADYSNANIAERLTISGETVRTHKKRIFAKLNVHKHEELMRLIRSDSV